MTKQDLFVKAITTVLSDASPDDIVLACMIIMHTYCFHLAPHLVLEDAGNTKVLSPLTRRHAAEIIGIALANCPNSRSDSDYWYLRYDADSPIEVASEITGKWRAEVDRVVKILKQTQFVSALTED